MMFLGTKLRPGFRLSRAPAQIPIEMISGHGHNIAREIIPSLKSFVKILWTRVNQIENSGKPLQVRPTAQKSEHRTTSRPSAGSPTSEGATKI